jgi:hypothetical protein
MLFVSVAATVGSSQRDVQIVATVKIVLELMLDS